MKLDSIGETKHYKTMKKLFGTQLLSLVVLIALLSLSGCKKTEEVLPENPQTIFDLKVSSSFDWKTTKSLTVNVAGMEYPLTITNTLYIKSVDGKSVFYNNLHEMNKSYTLQVAVPAYLDKIVISYGTISKTMDIVGTTVNFDYFVE